MKFMSGTCATAIVASLAFTLPTVQAAPMFVPKVTGVQSDIVQVRDGWYNGNRGFRYYRPGYRYNNGWWFPAGAFIAGALIGGAIANSNNYGPRYYGGYYPPAAYYPPQRYYPPGGYYGDPYYGNGSYNQYSTGGIPCTSKAQDAGLC